MPRPAWSATSTSSGATAPSPHPGRARSRSSTGWSASPLPYPSRCAHMELVLRPAVVDLERPTKASPSPFTSKPRGSDLEHAQTEWGRGAQRTGKAPPRQQIRRLPLNAHPTTPDGRYFVVRGRLWRCSNPLLAAEERQHWTDALMRARRAKGAAMRQGDREARETARQRVDEAKNALGERGDRGGPMGS